MAIPTDQNTWLRRKPTADALTEAGYPTSVKTLRTCATRDKTLPYRVNGKEVEYRWGDALRWRTAKIRYVNCDAPKAA